LKPRKRIWNQSGVKQLVTITVPKNLKRAYNSNLSPTEVKSRLKALADTIDSRGWAVKNVELGYYTRPSLLGNETSDRLLNLTSVPQEVPSFDTATSDIFDIDHNPVARKLDAMMSQSAGAHRQQIIQQMAQQTPVQPQAVAVAAEARTGVGARTELEPESESVVGAGLRVGSGAAQSQTSQTSQQSQANQTGQPSLFIQTSQAHQPTSYWHMRTVSPVAAPPVMSLAEQAALVAPASPMAGATGYPAPFTPPAAAPAYSSPNTSLNTSSNASLNNRPNNSPNTSPGNSPNYWEGDELALSQQLQPPATTSNTSSTSDTTSKAVPIDYTNLRTPSAQPTAAAPAQPAQPPVTDTPNPDILELANNNDLNIATIAREAQARNARPTDEVVVSLH
jgi:hypothetical protein